MFENYSIKRKWKSKLAMAYLNLVLPVQQSIATEVQCCVRKYNIEANQPSLTAVRV